MASVNIKDTENCNYFDVQVSTVQGATPACIQTGAFAESCQNGFVECFESCFRHLLIKDNTIIRDVCNNSNPFTFIDIPRDESAVYTVRTIYRHVRVCNLEEFRCFVFIHSNSFQLLSDPCLQIKQDHDMNQDAIINRSNIITSNCIIDNNKSTTLASSEGITLTANFTSGFGSNTFFTAKIEGCPIERNAVEHSSNRLIQLESNTIDKHKLKTHNNDSLSLAVSKIISIFPNPTRRELTVTLPEGKYNLELNDITGKLVADFGSNTQATQILDISHLENGMYFLKIYNHQTQHIERIVVQK